MLTTWKNESRKAVPKPVSVEAIRAMVHTATETAMIMRNALSSISLKTSANFPVMR